MTSLSEALHARLDELGAPPREQIDSDEDIDETEGEVEESEEEDLPEVEEEEASEGEEPEGEAEPVAKGEKYKVKDLAEAIGWTPEDLYNDLVVPLGNGETLTLGELKNQRDMVAAQQAEIEQARAEIQNRAQQVFQQQQSWLQTLQGVNAEIDEARGEVRAIEAQYGNVDWDRLDRENPGQAANFRQKFASAYATANQRLQQAQQRQESEAQALRTQQHQEQDRRLFDLIPEWRGDMKRAQEEMPKIQEYLTGRGFHPAELQTIFHAGARAVARDAWLWSEHQKEVAKATNKMRKAPKKVLRAGKTDASAKERNVATLEKRAIATGSRNDVMNAARAIMKSSMNRR